VTKVDLVVTLMDHNRASVNKVIEGEAGYVACSENSYGLTFSRGREDAELRSLPREGESGTRRYEGGKARSKQR